MSSRTSRTRACMLAAALALASGTAAAQAVDQYQYQPDTIYPVRTGLGLTTQIELSPNEKVLDYSTGFSSGWELTRRGNVFYLKPKNIDVDTNMMVRTERHSYIFELKVVATDWRNLDQARRAGVQYKIAFDYPSDTEFGVAQEAVEEEAQPLLSTALAKDRRYNFDYSYSTPREEDGLVDSGQRLRRWPLHLHPAAGIAGIQDRHLPGGVRPGNRERRGFRGEHHR